MGDKMNDSDFDEDFIENVTECPGCGEPCGHEILREKKAGSGTDFLVKCDECGKVHTVQFRIPRAITVPFLLSEGANTVINHIELDEDESISLGDIFEHDDASWEVNRIENRKSESKKALIATKIGRVNAVRSDVVMVRLTLTVGEHSRSDSIFVDRDTTFQAGTIFEHQGQTWRIRAIHTGAGRTMSGRVVAHEIKRIYLHEPPQPEQFSPRTPRERRQALKEGKLGYNPNPIIPDAEKAGKSKQKRQGKRKMKRRR